ncbi:MAG: zf-HC2 domain-containing protein [Methylovulum sp.]|nr:zf-HC2 domain-containing protein [Methylovulum sp.]
MQVMTCDDIRLLISRAFEHDLADREARQLAGHLADCPACRTHQATQMAVMGWIDGLNGVYGSYALASNFGQELMAAISTRLPPAEALRQFNRHVAQNPGLQGQMTQTSGLGSFIQLYVQLGNAYGFRFSDKELKEQLGMAANDEELSDLELDAVVGGTGCGGYFLDQLLKP